MGRQDAVDALVGVLLLALATIGRVLAKLWTRVTRLEERDAARRPSRELPPPDEDC